MNILTVAFRGDLANLLYQALSLKKNWLGEKRWIIVVEDCQETTSYCRLRILPLMEGWCVDIYDNYVSDTGIGWHRQQCLKFIAVKEFASSDDVLIVDAKNYLLLPTDETTFIKNGYYQVQVQNETEIGKSDWSDTCDFFKIRNKVRPYNTTPWVWKKQLVLDTIDEFLDKGFDVTSFGKIPVSEFEAYWILNQDKIAWQEASLSEGVFSDEVTLDVLLQRIHWLKVLKKPFWTFHRYHWNNTKLVKINNQLLEEYGIIDDRIANEWIATSKIQYLLWPNKMTRC